MKLHELIADVIRNYKAPSLETLYEWELMAIDLVTENAGHELMNAEAQSFLAGKVVVDQSEYDLRNVFQEFLKWHMGADWLNRTLIKCAEWMEKQE